MPNKVTWKKGMRLSTEIFNAMDEANLDIVCHVSALASAGRCGLFPTRNPFELSVNINNNMLEVTSLNCHGVTASGKIIDIEFDSDFSHTFDTRLTIPHANEGEAFLLLVRMRDDQWREVNEVYSEAVYTFELVGENTVVDDDCMPIGCVINQYGWRLDETDFVPPCLYVRSHYKYVELLEKGIRLAKSMYMKCLSAGDCVARNLLLVVSSGASVAYQRLDKERETLTPGQMNAIVQQLVGSFLSGCVLDEYITLENPDPFMMYVQKPFDSRNILRDIETGLSLCGEIETKLNNVCLMTEKRPAPVEKPTPRQKPKPQPEVDPMEAARRRWEGIEI